jgi:hypothetical protein
MFDAEAMSVQADVADNKVELVCRKGFRDANCRSVNDTPLATSLDHEGQ